jgi:hypothetical protein
VKLWPARRALVVVALEAAVAQAVDRVERRLQWLKDK